MKLWFPALRPESVQLVAPVGDAEVGQSPPATPPSRDTEYVTDPVVGGVTVDQLRATVPAPGVALVIDGVANEPTLAAATPEPA